MADSVRAVHQGVKTRCGRYLEGAIRTHDAGGFAKVVPIGNPGFELIVSGWEESATKNMTREA
jgi:hypothetical protein